MRQIWRVFSFAFIALSMMGCALTSIGSNLLGSGKPATVSQMWSDVPVMDGMTQESIDIPLPVTLLIQGYFSAASENQGKVDFIAYNTTKTPQDASAFYSLDKMQAAGWNLADEPGCSSDLSGADSSVTSVVNGFACFFGKDDSSDQQSFLAIIGTQDAQNGKMEVFFARVQVMKETPTP